MVLYTELGRQYIDDTFGDQIETYVEENVIPEQNDEAAINRLIEKGCDLIFVTSSAMNMAGLKAAIAHPSVKILIVLLTFHINISGHIMQECLKQSL